MNLFWCNSVLNSDLQSAPFKAVFWQLLDIILSLKRDESIIHHFLCLLNYYKYDVTYRHHRHLFGFWTWRVKQTQTNFLHPKMFTLHLIMHPTQWWTIEIVPLQRLKEQQYKLSVIFSQRSSKYCSGCPMQNMTLHCTWTLETLSKVCLVLVH